MRALIHEVEGAVGVGATDVAGQPLLVRQLQWLRDVGIEDVVVELASGAADVLRGELLLSSEPLVARCVVVPTEAPIGVEALADRAGLEDDELFLALPADLLAHARCELPQRPRRLRIAPPERPGQERAPELCFRTRRALPSGEVPTVAGWALHVRERGVAHALGCAALMGEVEGLLVHGAEVRPGVWLARGARVDEDVSLVPPVLVGARARVFARARLGPNVLLGPGAVVEREAELAEVSVASDTLVGEGAQIRKAHVDPHGMTSLVDGARTDVDDPLLLTQARAPAPRLGARTLAALLMSLLALPWMLASALFLLGGRRPLKRLRFGGARLHVGTLGIRPLDLCPALYDVVLGSRDLVGVARPSLLEAASTDPGARRRAGALDITDAIAPSASPATTRCMWRWYLLNKRPALDRALLEARSGRGRGEHS